MHFSNVDTSEELPVMEHFYTIQGEGYFAGKSAYFIRLAGCDVGCVWCDVKDSWDVEAHPILKIDSLLREINLVNANLVVITGGEPALYNLSTLINKLKKTGIRTAIETSGCYKLIGDIDWYCFSPKKFKSPCEDAYKRANELKVIIYNETDFKWAEEHAHQVNEDCILFLQPEWGRQDRMLPAIIEYVKSNPKWRISLQTHKFMNIP
jgi:organic radical activating enzyme